MKMKRIISALIVFTLVMACAVSASAATGSITSMYTLDGNIRVKATVTDAAEGDMVSYVLYNGDNIGSDSIVYIDQATQGESGNIEFDVTDTITRFKDAKFKFGTNASTAVTAPTEVDVNADLNASEIKWATIDFAPFYGADGDITILFTVSEALKAETVGLNVTFTPTDANTTGEELVLNGLKALRNDSDTTVNLGIQLVKGDASFDKYFDSTMYTVSAVPYYGATPTVLSKQNEAGSEVDTGYYVEHNVTRADGAGYETAEE